MNRFLLFAFVLCMAAGLRLPALAQTDGLPPRPVPFSFVNDQASLLAPADARKLDKGLRRYADNTGTQVVVVTVPTLGGRTVADYGRALGSAWGVGQRDKNNGIVVLISAQERQVTIQPGSGLSNTITPEVTSRIISQMTPGFKQGNYFAGLRTGLNTLMATANPASVPRPTQPASSSDATSSTAATSPATVPAESNAAAEPAAPAAYDPIMAAPTQPEPTGPGLGTLLIGALVIGGGLWLVVRMFRNRSRNAADTNTNQRATPNFRPNQPGGSAPEFYPNRPGGSAPEFYPNRPAGQAPSSSSGPGIGGMLATGAAAAAGAYLGNRMASGSHSEGANLSGYDSNPTFNSGAAGAAGAAGTGAASDYFSSRDGGGVPPEHDYFSDSNTAADNSGDYFSADDNSAYDDTSSDDTGGGGFDGDSDNSGSW